MMHVSACRLMPLQFTSNEAKLSVISAQNCNYRCVPSLPADLAEDLYGSAASYVSKAETQLSGLANTLGSNEQRLRRYISDINRGRWIIVAAGNWTVLSCIYCPDPPASLALHNIAITRPFGTSLYITYTCLELVKGIVCCIACVAQQHGLHLASPVLH